MRFPSQKTLAWLAFAASSLAATSASAAPLITQWDYEVTSVFTSATYEGAGAGTANGCETLSDSAIRWGNCSTTSSQYSSIGITNAPRSGTISTDNVAKPANTYTHRNQPLSADFATLTSATIQSTLKIRPTGSGADYTSAETTYTIRFNETTNATPCLAPSPVGNPCNDIWVLDGSLNAEFILDGNKYYFSFYAEPALTNLNNLNPGICASVGITGACSGFTTIEGQNNEVNFVMRLTSEPIVIDVPEPASIALFGAGLLGLAGVRRRQQKRQA